MITQLQKSLFVNTSKIVFNMQNDLDKEDIKEKY